MKNILIQPQSCIHLCTSKLHLGFQHSLFLTTTNFPKQSPRKMIVTQCHRKADNKNKGVKGKKDNVWSIDNEMAKANEEREVKEKGKPRGRKRGKRVAKGSQSRSGRIMVSGAMLMEVETVLQTQEPVIKPAWNTFASSVSGIWKGVGAVFSPITAEMEPVEIGAKNENLYDCFTLSRIKAIPSSSGGPPSQILRKINWITSNPYGEALQDIGGNSRNKVGNASLLLNQISGSRSYIFSDFKPFDFEKSDQMEEDVMGNEPGLVFFEDGSYSRGPVDIPIGEVDDPKYYLSPTFKFEQCLVKGCHKRLRIVHTIEFSNGGSSIQIMRVAVYEEQWVSPANISDYSDLEFDARPFSQRERTQPLELTGSWKVFEVSATPVYGEETVTEDSNGAPYVYMCTENLKKRNLPENPIYFGEEEMVDMVDVTILWLPGGVTAYVDVNKDGILCIGFAWYSEEGVNLVMERDYGLDGKLKEVRYKTEVKRRWSDFPV